MFRNSYQAGFLSILYSIGSKPLELWEKKGAKCATCRRRAAAAAAAASLTRSPRAPRRLAPWPVRNGHIKRITDGDIQSSVLEVAGTNVSTTYISCPADGAAGGAAAGGGGLGIKLPFLVMIIKNMKKYLTFEVTILDDKNVRRRFRASNFQVSARARVRGTRAARAHGSSRPLPARIA